MPLLWYEISESFYFWLRYWLHTCHDRNKTVILLVRWRHHAISMMAYSMEIFSPSLAFCAGNSPVTGEFPAQRPVTRSFDVFFDLRLRQQLTKQWARRWFETPSCSLWRHCNAFSVSQYRIIDLLHHWLTNALFYLAASFLLVLVWFGTGVSVSLDHAGFKGTADNSTGLIDIWRNYGNT